MLVGDSLDGMKYHFDRKLCRKIHFKSLALLTSLVVSDKKSEIADVPELESIIRSGEGNNIYFGVRRNEMPWLAHRDPERLRLRTSGDYAAIVIRKNDARQSSELGIEDCLNAAVAIIYVEVRDHR